MRDDCAVVRPALGVYLLGTIDPADRSAVDRHLAGCARCREVLASLAGLPGLLQRIPVAEAAMLGSGRADTAGPPPAELLDRLLRRVSRLRRRRRWQLGAVSAALIAATATSLIAQAGEPAERPASHSGRPWATAAGFDPVTRAGATVRYAARAGGTELEVHVTGIPVGTTCQFWVTGTAGQHIPAGAWAVLPGQQRVWYPGSVPVPPAGLRGFDVTSGGAVLVVIAARRAGTRPRTRAVTVRPQAAWVYSGGGPSR